MKPETTNQPGNQPLPLYKVLNKQRTQGNFEPVCNAIRRGMDEIGKYHFMGEKENKANAQYTALAVNELANLAEALEAIYDHCHNKECTIAIIAKEALSRIS